MLPRITWLALVVAVAATLASPIEAGHCTSWWTTQAEVDTTAFVEDLVDSRVYVDFICNENCPSGTYGAAIYEEANNRNGLQRDDGTVRGTCHGQIDPDARILA